MIIKSSQLHILNFDFSNIKYFNLYALLDGNDDLANKTVDYSYYNYFINLKNIESIDEALIEFIYAPYTEIFQSCLGKYFHLLLVEQFSETIINICYGLFKCNILSLNNSNIIENNLFTFGILPRIQIWKDVSENIGVKNEKKIKDLYENMGITISEIKSNSAKISYDLEIFGRPDGIILKDETNNLDNDIIVEIKTVYKHDTRVNNRIQSQICSYGLIYQKDLLLIIIDENFNIVNHYYSISDLNRIWNYKKNKIMQNVAKFNKIMDKYNLDLYETLYKLLLDSPK